MPIVCVFDRVVNSLISVQFWLSIGSLFLCSMVYTQSGTVQMQRVDDHLLVLDSGRVGCQCCDGRIAKEAVWGLTAKASGVFRLSLTV